MCLADSAVKCGLHGSWHTPEPKHPCVGSRACPGHSFWWPASAHSLHTCMHAVTVIRTGSCPVVAWPSGMPCTLCRLLHGPGGLSAAPNCTLSGLADYFLARGVKKLQPILLWLWQGCASFMSRHTYLCAGGVRALCFSLPWGVACI